MTFPDRNDFLEFPDILQDKGTLLHNVFVADDIPRGGRRDLQNLCP